MTGSASPSESRQSGGFSKKPVQIIALTNRLEHRILTFQPLVYAHLFPVKWVALVTRASYLRATNLLLNSMPSKSINKEKIS